MNVNIRNRFLIFGGLFTLLFAIIFVQLIKLTLVQGASYAGEMEKLSPRTVTESGARGSIYDRNGLPLAYDIKSYNVQFYKDPLKKSDADKSYYTGIILDAIKIIEQNGGEVIDTFAIKYDDKTGGYYFDFGITNKDAIAKREKNWRSNMYVGITRTPEQIYLYLRDHYQIPAEMGYEEARKILSIWQEVQLASWVAYEPVTIAYNVNIQTVSEIETHSAELSGMSISEGTTRIYPRGSIAAHVIGYVSPITGSTLEKYGVPDLTKDDITSARKLLASPFYGPIIKQEYGEVSIPDNAEDLIKCPKNLTEFGFTEEQLKVKDAKTGQQKEAKGLQDLGYSVEDLIGVDGVEKSMEAYLTGNTTDRQGKQDVEVDNMAIVKKVLSSTEPTQGDNLMLTIDVPLQQAAEESLAKNIPNVIRKEQLSLYEEGKDKSIKRGGYKGLSIEDIKLADSGAAVVIDVNTGEILAMASYPSYDPNLFIQGITDKEFKELGYGDNELAPLLNRAVTSRGMPGSIFKMVTGLGALMEGQTDSKKGTTLNERITDLGEYRAILAANGHGPKCWTKYPSKHSNQTIVEGLMNSCDYYFYTLADRLGIELLDKWGEKYGLTEKTGIELPNEMVGQIGNQRVLYDPTKTLEKQATSVPMLVKKGKQYGLLTVLNKIASERGVQYSQQTISDTADALIALAGIEWKADANDRNILKYNGVAMGDYIRKILSQKMDIPSKSSVNNGWDRRISEVVSQLIWTKFMTATSGIGQGVVLITPVAVARYVASIVNGGTVYQAHIVDKVVDQSGQVVFDQQPEVYGTLGAPQEYLDKIMLGMSSVVSAEQGTAKKYFNKFKYKNSIGGKTGTAEVSEIDLENNSWFVCFAPYDKNDSSVKPKIAVVVYVPHGYSGGLSSYIAQDIVEFYLDREQQVAKQTIPESGSLVGN